MLLQDELGGGLLTGQAVPERVIAASARNGAVGYGVAQDLADAARVPIRRRRALVRGLDLALGYPVMGRRWLRLTGSYSRSSIEA